MTYHILPRLRPNHTVPTVNDVGTWTSSTRQVLEDIYKGLHVDKVESEINSIPDMWARPMLFEMALFDRQHVLHDRTVGEWRGLLAMIALKEVAKLNRFTAARIIVPELMPLPEGEEETEVQQRDFVRTLAKLIPKSSLADDTSWRNLYVFLFDGQPIGMTSPTTLVATSADYLNRISNQEVGWYNGTLLKDPVGQISPKQKQILAGWLTNLSTQLGGHRGMDNGRWDLLSGLLTNFVQELGGGTCSLSQSGFGIQGREAGLFRYLDKPADGNVQDASHVRLIPSEGRTPARPLLVVDRTIAEQWDMAPQNVTVEGAQTLASAQIGVTGADVWKAADFFTKKLFVIFQENAFPGTTGSGNQSLTLPGGTNSVTPILPLRSELMNHLTIDDLSSRVRWDQSPEGLTIHLFLKLSGPDPDNPGRTIELVKLYRREDIHTLDNVPILEVWPNFRAAEWKAYYTCYSTDDFSSTFAVKPFAQGALIDSEVTLKGRARRRYWRSESYPEAMICVAAVPNTESQQMERQDAGLLLLRQPETLEPMGRSYKIGVDFGAANTTVCARAGDERFPIKFSDLKVSITASGEIAQATLFNFFLPPGEYEMPLLSFFQSFDNRGSNNEVQPFLNGHIYMLPGAGSLDPNLPNIAVDLKWSSEDRDRRMVKAFLTQLCLQACAELVIKGAGSISWAFSYPTAFSAEQIEGFPEIWNQVTLECISLTGLRRDALNERQTESVATALYFVDHLNAATALGAIFIDIGGSTSDISVWQGEDDAGPIWQTSVLLAGRNLFSNYLWHNPKFLEIFGVADFSLAAANDRTKVDRKPYYALTDALLKYQSKLIFAELPVHAGSNEVKKLRQHLALGICGLLYYVGSLLQHLMRKGVYDQNIPNVYVGGNGSQIFRWLDIDGEDRLNALYKACFSRGAGWNDDQPFRVILSPEPKMEAAYGLVADQRLKDGNLERKVLAGEVFLADIKSVGKNKTENDSRQKAWSTILTAEDYTKRLRPAENLERLNDFVTTFDRFAKSHGMVAAVDFDNRYLQEVRRLLSQSISQYHNVKSPANVIVEPIFIMALRHLLEVRLEAKL